MTAANGESATRHDAAVSQTKEGQRQQAEGSVPIRRHAISKPTGHTGTERINGLVVLVIRKQEINLSKLLSGHGPQAVT